MRREWVAAVWVASSLGFACADDDGSTPDSGMLDAASATADAGFDAGPPDAGPPDVGAPDTFVPEPCDGPPGLYVDPDCMVIADDVRAFEPAHWLWSDGTDKQRFVSLPEGSVIDTSEPDRWIYPVGTRVWKTFLVDGMKVETRYFEKAIVGIGFSAWSPMRTFVWNEEQDAVSEVMGGMENALGTEHDIPTIEQCVQCHAQPGFGDVLLGFTAIQLNHEDTETSLADLVAEERLSNPAGLVEAAVVPGDETQRAALGYLHANCGGCHGGDAAQAGFRTRLAVGLAAAEDAAIYDAIGQSANMVFGDATLRIAAGQPELSTLYVRTGLREGQGEPPTPEGRQMPPIGSEVVDDEGRMLIEAWIESLPE